MITVYTTKPWLHGDTTSDPILSQAANFQAVGWTTGVPADQLPDEVEQAPEGGRQGVGLGGPE